MANDQNTPIIDMTTHCSCWAFADEALVASCVNEWWRLVRMIFFEKSLA